MNRHSCQECRCWNWQRSFTRLQQWRKWWWRLQQGDRFWRRIWREWWRKRRQWRKWEFNKWRWSQTPCWPVMPVLWQNVYNQRLKDTPWKIHSPQAEGCQVWGFWWSWLWKDVLSWDITELPQAKNSRRSHQVLHMLGKVHRLQRIHKAPEKGEREVRATFKDQVCQVSGINFKTTFEKAHEGSAQVPSI